MTKQLSPSEWEDLLIQALEDDENEIESEHAKHMREFREFCEFEYAKKS